MELCIPTLESNTGKVCAVDFWSRFNVIRFPDIQHISQDDTMLLVHGHVLCDEKKSEREDYLKHTSNHGRHLRGGGDRGTHPLPHFEGWGTQYQMSPSRFLNSCLKLCIFSSPNTKFS